MARFTLAHFNDLQARYGERIAGRSRYGYIAGYLRQLKTEVEATLVLDAGDDYEKGSIAELRSMGGTTRQMIQALPIDVRTIGNHDFAYGKDAVLADVSGSAHPVLAANVRQAGVPDDRQPFARFVRIDVGCVKVGVIGLVTQNYGADDRPTSEAFDEVFDHDGRYMTVLEREIAAHRAEVDVMIALTHLGFWQDSALASSPSARGIDLVVGGHTEDLLRTPVVVGRRDGSRSWVLQAGHYGRVLGRADLIVNLREHKVAFERYRIVNVDASLPLAADVADLAERLEGEHGARDVVGRTRGEIKRGRDMSSLVFRAAKAEWRADALVIGRDLFWDGLPRGDVTLQRMYDAVLVQRQPAGTSGFTSLSTMELSGAELERVRARVRSGLYDVFMPARVDPKARYRLVVDKRARTFPRILFGTDTAWPPPAAFEGLPAAEIIDLLETYARARSARGEPID